MMPYEAKTNTVGQRIGGCNFFEGGASIERPYPGQTGNGRGFRFKDRWLSAFVAVCPIAKILSGQICVFYDLGAAESGCARLLPA